MRLGTDKVENLTIASENEAMINEVLEAYSIDCSEKIDVDIEKVVDVEVSTVPEGHLAVQTCLDATRMLDIDRLSYLTDDSSESEVEDDSDSDWE